jgi:single-strand DNA-binding protein
MNTIECATEGRVVSEPEHRTSKAGKPYARLRVVVGDGDAAQWLNVTAVGEKALAELAGLAKGDRVYLEGSIKLERWTAQDGAERSGLGVLAWKVLPLAKIGRNKPAKPKEGDHAAPVSGPADYQRPLDDPGGGRRAFDDQIPFAAEWR